MYLIIVRAGTVWSPLIEIATRGGNEVVVERDEEQAEPAAAAFDRLSVDDSAVGVAHSSLVSPNRATTATGPTHAGST